MKDNILLGIPVYNEEKYIDRILKAAQKHIQHIFVVNDGSIDNTNSIIQQHVNISALSHEINQGYGQSMIDIFQHAIQKKIEWVITMDCDFQHEPDHIPYFLNEIGKADADIISGSRYLMTSFSASLQVPKERLEINRCITSLLNEKLGLNLTDAFCGFKAYRVECLRTLNLSEKGYGFPLQLWIQAAKSKLRIRELAVPLIYHDPSRHFAGELENPRIRQQYYLKIIEQNLAADGNKNTN